MKEEKIDKPSKVFVQAVISGFLHGFDYAKDNLINGLSDQEIKNKKQEGLEIVKGMLEDNEAFVKFCLDFNIPEPEVEKKTEVEVEKEKIESKFEFKDPICKKNCGEKSAKLCYANHFDSHCVILIRELRSKIGR